MKALHFPDAHAKYEPPILYNLQWASRKFKSLR